MLKNLTSEALQAELDRRKEPVLVAPYPRSAVEFQKHSHTLYRQCCSYITDLARDGRVDDDLDHYIFEAAISAVFGEKVWDYIRAKKV